MEQELKSVELLMISLAFERIEQLEIFQSLRNRSRNQIHSHSLSFHYKQANHDQPRRYKTIKARTIDIASHSMMHMG
jgi:hypothetical protein